MTTTTDIRPKFPSNAFKALSVRLRERARARRLSLASTVLLAEGYAAARRS